MSTFKFIERQYMEDFFKHGRLKLGTLFEYTDVEAHGYARGDSAEGTHTVRRDVKSISLDSKSTEPLISEMFRVHEGANAVLEDCIFESVRRVPHNMYVFCSSLVYSDDALKLWNQRVERNPPDACYEIISVRHFFQSIYAALRRDIRGFRCAPVVYTDRHIDYMDPASKLTPEFTKQRAGYGWQTEHRAVFTPHAPEKPIKPWIVEVPEAREYCRPVSVLDGGEVRPL